ncbi:hypothetical protein PQQ63_08205 [Paraburkholderia metrosideri]|uniref:Uncharacterized protein n=1 Tax=Paraburkholderia metrosideri TaxID=580937 RepID=A0ABW9DMV6_9BURK
MVAAVLKNGHRNPFTKLKEYPGSYLTEFRNMPLAYSGSKIDVASHLLTLNSWPIHLNFRKIAQSAVAQSANKKEEAVWVRRT